MPTYIVKNKFAESEQKKIDNFLKFYKHSLKVDEKSWLVTSSLDSFDFHVAVYGSAKVSSMCLDISDVKYSGWIENPPSNEVEAFLKRAKVFETRLHEPASS